MYSPTQNTNHVPPFTRIHKTIGSIFMTAQPFARSPDMRHRPKFEICHQDSKRRHTDCRGKGWQSCNEWFCLHCHWCHNEATKELWWATRTMVIAGWVTIVLMPQYHCFCLYFCHFVLALLQFCACIFAILCLYFCCRNESKKRTRGLLGLMPQYLCSLYTSVAW